MATDITLELIPMRLKGEKLSIGDSMWMDASLETSVNDCIRWIAEKLGNTNDEFMEVKLALGDFDPVEALVEGNGINWTIARGGCTKSVSYFSCHNRPIFAKCTRVQSQSPSDNDGHSLTVKTLTRQTVTLKSLCSSSTIDDVKRWVFYHTGIPKGEQRLSFCAKSLMDEQITLAEYGIHSESTLYLDLNRRAGGSAATFVDIEKEEALVVQQWNKRPYRWRTACAGLTLEGICRNESCQAHEKWVIMNLGFQSFDLINPTPAALDCCICPICADPVKPLKPGFNRCLWKFRAVKHISPTNVIERAWKRAYNDYTTYDEHLAGMAEYKQLVFDVRNPSSTNITCPFCWKHVKEEDMLRNEQSGFNQPMHAWCLAIVMDMHKEALKQHASQA